MVNTKCVHERMLGKNEGSVCNKERLNKYSPRRMVRRVLLANADQLEEKDDIRNDEEMVGGR